MKEGEPNEIIKILTAPNKKYSNWNPSHWCYFTGISKTNITLYHNLFNNIQHKQIMMKEGTNQMPKELKNFYIKSMKLAGFLMQRGFVLCAMKPDLDSIRNIFIFKNSPQLICAIDDYKQMKGCVKNGATT